jgi:pilus assembly protein CpaC
MNKLCRCGPFIKLGAVLFFVLQQTLLVAYAAIESQEIRLEVGGSYYLKVKEPTRIAVGNSQIVQASPTGQSGILIFGKSRGVTTVNVWSAGEQHQSIIISVAAGGFEQSFRLISRLLQDIPAAKVSKAQDKIVIEGSNLSDQDRARVAQIVARYPDVLDLTGAVGWDRMVLLDVQVIELPSTRIDELGLRWNTGSAGNIYGGFAWDGSPQAVISRPGVTADALTYPATKLMGILGVSALLNARLHALSQTGEAVILAQPQLLTRSGSTANFLAGGEVPYSTTDKDGRTHTAFKKYGISLNITPQAHSSGTVRSTIEIEVSSVDPTISLPSGPALRVRKASTEFNVGSGQTLVLGGFVSREWSSERDGLPGLSGLPIVGGLFGTERKIERQTELAILVTPNIVDPVTLAGDSRIEKVQNILAENFTQASHLGQDEVHREMGEAQSLPASSLEQWGQQQ